MLGVIFGSSIQGVSVMEIKWGLVPDMAGIMRGLRETTWYENSPIRSRVYRRRGRGYVCDDTRGT